MTREDLTGMVPPLVVPFTEDGNMDEEAFRKEVRYLLDCGVDGLSSGGSTGEGALLSDAELRRCLELIHEVNLGRAPVYAGIIRNATRDVIRAGLDAKSLGASALLVTPVYYHGATEDENFQFYREIGEKIQMPVIIYNVVPTNMISPKLFQRISRLEWVIGIKQVDPVKLAEIAAANEGNYNVYAACDHLLYSSYVAGACGAISALITVAPQLCVRQWQAFKQGNRDEAMRIHKKLVPIVTSYFEAPFPAKLKAMISMQGRTGGFPQRPMKMPDAICLQNMKTALADAGLLVKDPA